MSFGVDIANPSWMETTVFINSGFVVEFEGGPLKSCTKLLGRTHSANRLALKQLLDDVSLRLYQSAKDIFMDGEHLSNYCVTWEG